jgi:hypothetical protein
MEAVVPRKRRVRFAHKAVLDIVGPERTVARLPGGNSPMNIPICACGPAKVPVSSDRIPTSQSGEKHCPNRRTFVPEFASDPTFVIRGARASALGVGPNVTPRGLYWLMIGVPSG